MAVSEAKRAANGRNALRSTGPRTAEGKAAACRNALRHGVFAGDVAVLGESRREYRGFRDGMLQRLNPRDLLELDLVEEYIWCAWRLRRLREAERAQFEQYAAECEERVIRARRDRLRTAEDQFRDADFKLEDAVPECRERLADVRNRWAEELQDAKAAMEECVDLEPAGTMLRGMLAEETVTSVERHSVYEQRLCNSMRRILSQLTQLREKHPEEELTDIAKIAMGADRRRRRKAEDEDSAPAEQDNEPAAPAPGDEDQGEGASASGDEVAASDAIVQNEPTVSPPTASTSCSSDVKLEALETVGEEQSGEIESDFEAPAARRRRRRNDAGESGVAQAQTLVKMRDRPSEKAKSARSP